VNAAAAAGCEAIARSQQSPRTQNYSGASERDRKNGDKKIIKKCFYFFLKENPLTPTVEERPRRARYDNFFQILFIYCYLIPPPSPNTIADFPDISEHVDITNNKCTTQK